jgi:serine/threonine-protein kinase
LKKNTKTRMPNWAIGVIVTGLFCLSFVFSTSIGFIGEIELKTYDLRMKLFAPAIESDRIAIVAIDSESISKLGRWPWPRHRVATIIDKISNSGAKVIGLNILFSELEEGTGLGAVRELNETFSALKLHGTPNGQFFLSRLHEMEIELDNDAKLEDAVAIAGNVVLPFAFNMGGAIGARLPAAPGFVAGSAISAVAPSPEEMYFYPPSGSSMLYPIERLGSVALTVGHLNKFPDPRDGIDRWESLLIEYDGKYYPSFALAVAAGFLGYSGGDIRTDLRSGSGVISMGKAAVDTDDQLGILVNYYDPETSFPIYSFFDVFNDKINASAFKDKIVLIGITDLGLGDVAPTPISPIFSSVEREATVIENILTGETIVTPPWARLFALGAMIFFGLISTILLVKLSAKMGTIVCSVLGIVFIALVFYMFVGERMWVELTHPLLLLVVNYLAISSRRFWFTEKAQIAAESESDEANKLLGLTFQSKGMLEMAYEKYKTIPVDSEMKDVLYGLALNFEKKRNWTQALSVYERIDDKKFKDVKERLVRIAQYTSASGAAPVNLKGDSATILSEGAEMPTLGRYEVIRELGRGAMGVVYLGKDPKINRQVAIKTVNFDEVEEKMIDTLKQRFFREAESAGTLNHPNIMTIFDVGEEGSLAYIAMELIDGKDLDLWTKAENLLPVKDALLVVAKVADALDYAHEHGIVHRDIKPANIMVTKKREIKVTDFGIARILDASATKTGTIMGTPSYMSPEQVAGKKVDGRSDIFSLGVVLYEMLSAERPFTGDSIATIMYNITNGTATPIKEYKQGLPEFCQALIDKALSKDPEKRFQKAGEFSQAIKWCIKKYGNNL